MLFKKKEKEEWKPPKTRDWLVNVNGDHSIVVRCHEVETTDYAVGMLFNRLLDEKRKSAIMFVPFSSMKFMIRCPDGMYDVPKNWFMVLDKEK